MIRENIDSIKNIKKNQYSVKKDINSLSSDLKNLKEEHIYNSDKRVKVRSIVVMLNFVIGGFINHHHHHHQKLMLVQKMIVLLFKIKYMLVIALMI